MESIQSMQVAKLGFLPPDWSIEWVPEGSSPRLVYDLMGFLEKEGRLKNLTRGEINSRYTRLFSQVLFYAFSQGILSSRQIAHLIQQQINFRFLTGGMLFPHQAIRHFRQTYKEPIYDLFTECLNILQTMGLERFGNFSLAETAGQLAQTKGKHAEVLSSNAIWVQMARVLGEAHQKDESENSQWGDDEGPAELPEGLLESKKRQVLMRKALLKHQKYAVVEERTQKVEKKPEPSTAAAAGVNESETFLKGNLKEMPLPRLFGKLYQLKADGSLMLMRDSWKKVIYFRRGYPISVRSNLLSECLGNFLVRSKFISQEQKTRSVHIMRSTKRKQGSVLVEIGALSQEKLNQVLELHLRQKLFDVFGWEDGHYQFKPDAVQVSMPITLNLSCATAIFVGVLLKYKKERLIPLMEPWMDHFVSLHPDPWMRLQHMDLSCAEEEFFQHIKGNCRLRQLLKRHGNQERAYQLLFALHCANMIVFSSSKLQGADNGMAGVVSAPKSLPPRDLSQARKDLALTIQQMGEQNHFEQLGLKEGASSDDIQNAFHSLAAQYHPDLSSDVDSTQVKELNAKAYRIVFNAYQVLADDNSRQEYLQGIQSPKANPVVHQRDETADRVIRAEALFHKGQIAIRRGDYKWAVVLLEQAVNLCPQEGEYRSELGKALFHSNPQNHAGLDRAREHLNRAVADSPKLAQAHLYLGYIYRQMGQKVVSALEFEKALQCDPQYHEAQRELRLLRQRERKGIVRRKITSWLKH